MFTHASIFLSSFIIAFSGAMMPGPLLTVTISESSKKGFIAGPLLILGHGFLELVLVAALLLGLAPLLQKKIVFSSIGISGGIILLWMSFSMFKSIPDLNLSSQTDVKRDGYIIINGILFSISNPYWTIWWATIGMAYILQSMNYGISGVLSFFAGHILADLIWYASISYAVSKGKNLLSNVLYRIIIGFCAAILMIFGGFFFIKGLNSF